MSDRPAAAPPAAAISTSQHPTQKLRFVTAASLFDGHDAAINIMRRVLQAQGAEVIHLGHNRSVDEIVTAALQEDAHGIAVSSYQGGHVEFFRYMVAQLRERGGSGIQVFGGGGGVIVPDEIALLAQEGVRIFSPEDGQRLGLVGMIEEMLRSVDRPAAAPPDPNTLASDGSEAAWRELARLLSALECGRLPPEAIARLHERARHRRVPVVGITGTGGAGKSSLTDELILRLRLDQGDSLRIALLSIDPSRRRSGGALLGDRIRMNAIGPWADGSGPSAGPPQAGPHPLGGSVGVPADRGAQRARVLCARSLRGTRAQRSPPPCPTCSPPASLPALTCCSSRPRASARATPPSSRTSMCRSM